MQPVTQALLRTIASNYAVVEEVVPLFLGDLRSSGSNRLEIGKLNMLIIDISLWALQHVKVRSASLRNQELGTVECSALERLQPTIRHCTQAAQEETNRY